MISMFKGSNPFIAVTVTLDVWVGQFGAVDEKVKSVGSSNGARTMVLVTKVQSVASLIVIL